MATLLQRVPRMVIQNEEIKKWIKIINVEYEQNWEIEEKYTGHNSHS